MQRHLDHVEQGLRPAPGASGPDVAAGSADASTTGADAPDAGRRAG